MERTNNEQPQWPFVADPNNSQNHHPLSSANHRLQINGAAHVSSNPNLQNPTFQNPDPFQNPCFAQRYSTPQLLPRASQQTQDQCLEDYFSRLDLNVPCNNHSDPNLDYNLLLHKLRIESAVRGQTRLLNNLNPTSFLGTQDLDTRSANHDLQFNPQRTSLSFDEEGYSCPFRMINNAAANRQWCGDASTENSSPLLPSSIYNNNNNNNHRPVNVYPGRRHLGYSSLEELRGQISSVAKDQHGCRFLQKKFDLEIVRREDIEMILSEVKCQLHELMVHQFANYLIQKLFEAATQGQRTELLILLVGSEQRFVNVCTDVHGTRAVQKFMDRISSPNQRSILMSALAPIAVTLTNNLHGHHIIEQCLNKFSNEETTLIVDEIIEHCLDIATDKSGCCVLQQCLAHAQPEARERLLAEITTNAFVLSEHPYGNYVVQYVIGMEIPHVTSNMIAHLRGCFVTLSMNKYGSNVVEKCLKDAGEENCARIIAEIIRNPDFVKVLQDPYGNYVVQSALKLSKGNIHNILAESIQRESNHLHSHLYGKKVLARTKERRNLHV